MEQNNIQADTTATQGATNAPAPVTQGAVNMQPAHVPPAALTLTAAVATTVANTSLPATTHIPFALTPAAANPGIIDYTTVAGRKMKENCTKKLTEELFDCVPEDLFSFLKALKDRARDSDWTGG